MIGAWKGASWPIRGAMLACMYVIVDSVASLGVLFVGDHRSGDPLDRFTAVRVEQQVGTTAVVYSYAHANSSAQVTAIYLADRDVPAIGDVRYRNPGGIQVLLSDLPPNELPLRWSTSGKPSLALPADIRREGDWSQRNLCLTKEKGGRRVCWNAAHIDVD